MSVDFRYQHSNFTLYLELLSELQLTLVWDFNFQSKIKSHLFLPPANEVWGKVIFSEACVKNSVHRRGLPQCMLGYHPHPPPGTRHPPPPGAGTPWDQAPPPRNRHPLGPGTPPGPSTPSRPCWEIRSTSGRYASYWNAFLLSIFFSIKPC